MNIDNRMVKDSEIVIRPNSDVTVEPMADDRWGVYTEWIGGSKRRIGTCDRLKDALIFAKGFDKGKLINSLMTLGKSTALKAVTYIETAVDLDKFKNED